MDMPTTRAEVDRGKTLVRSGTAARLAGLSASTLRIWEHRYAVVAPPKTATGQRTYSMKDVERLRLIKRLTVEGHAIGTLAHLDIDSLVELSSGNAALSTGVQRVVVVGHAAARKLEGRLQLLPANVFDDLSHAERDIAQSDCADVLVIHVPSLHESLTERLTSLVNKLSVRHAIVVYTFAAEAVAEGLRAAGVTVRREPVSGRELARLVVASRPNSASVSSGMPASARRFSEAELVALTEMPSMVACECPRHLAEIVTLLASFEQYSLECAARDEKDAALHRHLHDVTSTARTMLEQALERVVIEEGLVL
jgi:DNA-binding transcriptional MerR regulator